MPESLSGTAAIAIIAGVGFSRAYLGVHYPSDVIAGWALGIVWASVVISFAALSERNSGVRSTAVHRPSYPGAPAEAPTGQPNPKLSA